jgi:hypothetical protein
MVEGGPLSIQVPEGPGAVSSPVGDSNQVLKSGEYSTW